MERPLGIAITTLSWQVERKLEDVDKRNRAFELAQLGDDILQEVFPQYKVAVTEHSELEDFRIQIGKEEIVVKRQIMESEPGSGLILGVKKLDVRKGKIGTTYTLEAERLLADYDKPEFSYKSAGYQTSLRDGSIVHNAPKVNVESAYIEGKAFLEGLRTLKGVL